jgi:glycosyltransferase involved in cell wall biosynthesis
MTNILISFNLPFFSFVIPTYHSEESIKDTLSSIISQSFTDFEILIIDAMSSDNTLKAIKSFKDLRIRIISESDKGVYDAMNKGISQARGEWLLFLGSDDNLHNNDVLKKAAEFLKNASQPVVYGNTEVEGDVSWAKGEKIYGGKFSLYRLLRRNICHQAIFYKREFLLKNNLTYNLSYPISADWDFNLRAWLIQPFQYYPGIISYFTAGGISSGGRDDGFQQSIPTLYKKYYNNPYTNPISRFFFGLYKNLRK